MTRLVSYWDEEKAAIGGLFRANGVSVMPVVPFPEMPCPVCHQGLLRRYRYIRPRGAGQALIGYVWCPACWRYTGYTAVVPTGWTFDDPVTPREHEHYDTKGMDGLEEMLRFVGERPEAIG